MAYEVDFLPVGEEKSGDAIAMRFGDLSNHRQAVIVIDGGFGENTGQRLVRLIHDCYHTERVNLVVSTHPDMDHIGGLETVIDECRVEHLAMHLPWKHIPDILHQIDDNRVTQRSIGENLRSCLSAAVSLEKKAAAKGVGIVEPFAGIWWEILGGVIEVVGPEKSFYNSLLPHFDGMPSSYPSSPYPAVKFQSPPCYTPGQDGWCLESSSITDDSWTSARNNSSVVLQVTVDNRRLLFTGDAGIQALKKAASHLNMHGAGNAPLRMIQIPHHGSRNNVGPTVLNDIVGPIMLIDGWRDICAVASCAQNGAPRHPNDRVLNAFRRRGARCFETSGASFRHSFHAPPRAGEVGVAPYQFREYVEDPDD